MNLYLILFDKLSYISFTLITELNLLTASLKCENINVKQEIMEMSNLRCLSIVIVILSVINSVVNEQPKPLMGYTTEFGYKCDVSCIKTPENCIG